MTKLSEFAPYPEREEDVTADSIARNTAVSAFARQQLIDEYMQDNTAHGKRLYMTEIGTLVNQYGVAFLLRELAEVDKERADAAAKRLYGDWEDGASVAEWLWEWLGEYGIDPEQVNRVAAAQARESVKKLKDAA
ncbi:MAG: hypothetical protein JWO57_1699 [Pseudonocardiales bacterium]|nr:hypothetical protein [Pseudonocardiales bacterium]